MTDQFDRATEREEDFREAAIEAQLWRDSAQGKTWRDSAARCRLCEEPIHMARRRAVPGVQTCVDCQRELEYAPVNGHGD